MKNRTINKYQAVIKMKLLRQLCILAFCCISFTSMAQFHVLDCLTVGAGPDKEICEGDCVNLSASFLATKATNTYQVNNISANSPFPTTGGVPIIANTDDVWSPAINLPFDFCYFGTDYNQIVVGSNGVVSFDLVSNVPSTGCAWSFNQTLPSASLFSASIFGPYMDIDPSVPGSGQINYSISGNYPCRTLVVNFPNIAYFSCNNLFLTTQIVLYETSNVIEVYSNGRSNACGAWNNGNAVLGIQNQNGTNAFVAPARNTANWGANSEAWRFSPNGAPTVAFSWSDPNGNVISSNSNVLVCPTNDNSTYTAKAIYTNCDGTTFTRTDQVMVKYKKINELFKMKSEYCEDEAILPVIFPANVNSYRWVIHEFVNGNRIAHYYSNYINGPVTSVDLRQYWNGFQIGGEYAISIDYWTDCGFTIYSNRFTIKERERHSRCMEISCGEIFDPYNLPIDNPCGGPLLGIEDLVDYVSYSLTDPLSFGKSTVLKLSYECCDVLLCLNVSNEDEIIYKTICADETGIIRLEPCENNYGAGQSYEYTFNGEVIESNEPFLYVEYMPGMTYSVTTLTEQGCKCTVIYEVSAPIVSDVYASWCAGRTQFDLNSIIDPDCLGDIDSYVLNNNLTNEIYSDLIFNDETGGFELFGNGGGGDLLCLTLTTYKDGCIKCIVNITLRFYDGDCNNEPDPIYCRDIYGRNTMNQEELPFIDKQESDLLNGFTIHPNPSNGRYSLTFDKGLKGESKSYTINIASANGKNVLSKKDIPVDGIYNFDISKETSGIYFLTIQLGDKLSVKKLIKE